MFCESLRNRLMADSADRPLREPAREGARRGRLQLSLRGRALRFLARREHSRLELRRKLLTEDVDAGAVEALLDDLESKRLLSDRRFAEVLARSQGSGHGVATLSRTLARQGVSPEIATEVLAPLRQTERERALEVWKRRFEGAPSDLKARAKQHRFLLSRGFDPATALWVVKQSRRPPTDADGPEQEMS
jgi:regulatory protein